MQSQSIVRINGVLPDLTTLGDKEKSERAAEVEQKGMATNTSCSELQQDLFSQKEAYTIL